MNDSSFYYEKEVKSQEIASFVTISLFDGGIDMPYFNTERIFLVPSLDLKVKEKKKMLKFLNLLDNSGVGEIITKYIKNNTSSGGRPGYDYYRLFATVIYGFAFGRFTLRDLEDACKYDLRYIYLMEQETPVHTKFCEFINKVIVPNEEEIFSKLIKKFKKKQELFLMMLLLMEPNMKQMQTNINLFGNPLSTIKTFLLKLEISSKNIVLSQITMMKR